MNLTVLKSSSCYAGSSWGCQGLACWCCAWLLLASIFLGLCPHHFKLCPVVKLPLPFLVKCPSISFLEILVIIFMAHLDNPPWFLQVIPDLITSIQSLLPYMITFLGSKGLTLDVFKGHSLPSKEYVNSF